MGRVKSLVLISTECLREKDLQFLPTFIRTRTTEEYWKNEHRKKFVFTFDIAMDLDQNEYIITRVGHRTWKVYTNIDFQHVTTYLIRHGNLVMHVPRGYGTSIYHVPDRVSAKQYYDDYCRRSSVRSRFDRLQCSRDRCF